MYNDILPFFSLNQLDFELFVNSESFNSNCQLSSYNFNVEYLNTKCFNQFNANVHSIESSLHPDVNFFNNFDYDYTLECKYHFNDSFNNEEMPTTDQFSILALNINSIPKNLDVFELQFLNNLNYNFDILGFVETKLTKDIEHLYKLNSYNQYTNNNTRNSGGLALYCHSRLEVVVRKDLTVKTACMETLFVEIVSGGKNRIVGLIYRRPNTNKINFINGLEEIIEKVSTENKLIYLSGDFNLNLLKKDTCLQTKNLINLFNSNNYVSLINKPSRITNHSTTIIDQIWSNDYRNILRNGLFYDFTSDHFPVFSIFKNSLIKNNNNNTEKETITYRSFTDENILKFKNDLQIIDWNDRLNGNDTIEKFDNFILLFSDLFDQNFPKLTKVIRKRPNNKPYINQEIKLLIKEKEKMQKKYAKYPITYGEQYKKFRNLVTNEIRKAKHTYFKNKLNSSSGDTKNTWKVINQILKPNNEIDKNKVNSFINPSDQQEKITDDKMICEMFNNYYVNAGKNLSNNIIDNNIPATDYLDSRVSETLIFPSTDELEVTRLVECLDDSAAGVDDIPARIIKSVSREIAYPLTTLFNLSMRDGIFPDQFKIAKITPIFKKDNKQELKNYRPISVLPCLSKILEKLIHDRLTDFLTNHQVISETQHGFRKQKSTTSAILQLTDNILNSFDQEQFTIALFLDLSKAFETVDHHILLNKLEHYGIRETSLKWFESYLKNRKQIVKYKTQISSLQEISLSVPQGSLLGPTLFNIYINDITLSVNKLKSVLYADDSCFYLNHTNISTAINIINNELETLGNWFSSNKLTLNYEKSHFVLFSRKKKIQNNLDPIKINNINITQVRSTIFLGVTLQHNLSWKTHIDLILNKLNKFKAILYLTRNSLNNHSLKLIYFSLVYPSLTYCSIIWGKAPKKYLNQLFVAQKKIIRTIKYRDRYHHTNTDFIQLNFLKFYDVLKYFALVFVYKSLNNISCPLNYFEYSTHTYNLRRQNNLRAPFMRSSQSQTSISFFGCHLWNDLPLEIRNKPSLGSFKHSVRRRLMAQYSQN